MLVTYSKTIVCCMKFNNYLSTYLLILMQTYVTTSMSNMLLVSELELATILPIAILPVGFHLALCNKARTTRNTLDSPHHLELLE